MESELLIARINGLDGRNRELEQEVWDSGSASPFLCFFAENLGTQTQPPLGPIGWV